MSIISLIKVGEKTSNTQWSEVKSSTSMSLGLCRLGVYVDCPSLNEEAMWGDFQGQVTDQESDFPVNSLQGHLT